MESTREILFGKVAVVALAAAAVWRTLSLPNPGLAGYAMTTGLCIVAAYILLVAVLHTLDRFFLYTMKRKVRGLLRDLRELCSCDHEYAVVPLESFHSAESSYYLEMASSLETHGFKSVADVENRTHSRIYPDSIYCERVMRTLDGVTLALFSFHRWRVRSNAVLKQGQWIRKFCLRTHFADDTFFITQFSDGLPMMACPQHFTEQLSWESGLLALITRHAGRVAQRLSEDPPTTVIPSFETRDFVAAMAASQRILNKDRKERGFLSPQELRKMAAELGGTQRQIDRVVNVFEEVLAEQQKFTI